MAFKCLLFKSKKLHAHMEKNLKIISYFQPSFGIFIQFIGRLLAQKDFEKQFIVRVVY